MVEYDTTLNQVFASLSDPTRRDMLKRISREEMSISEIAKPYKLSFAAISKHLIVMEKAKLVVKSKRGNEHVVKLSPTALTDANKYIKQYKRFWENKFNSLEEVLRQEQSKD